MNKIKILIIALLTILVSNNVNAQSKAQPQTPHVTTFTIEKNIMESGVDLNTANMSLHIFGVIEGTHQVPPPIYNNTTVLPATTYFYTCPYWLAYGYVEVNITGQHAWGYAKVDFSNSPLNVHIVIDVYAEPQQNPHE